MVLHKPKDLAKILNYSLEELEDICQDINANRRKHYYSYKKIKRKGGKVKIREIDPSRQSLRDIQNRINGKLLSKINFPPHIHGSVKGKSNISNAKCHRTKKFHFLTDLSSFFPSVTCSMVFQSLREYGYSPDVAHIITKLTTINGHLPQGTPTSSALANLVGLKFDYPILELCKQHGITYTRYVDDLTFSCNEDFKEISQEILNIISQAEFKYSHKKTLYKEGKVEITGCLVKTNGKLALTAKQEAKLEDLNLPPKSRAGLEGYRKLVESA